MARASRLGPASNPGSPRRSPRHWSNDPGLRPDVASFDLGETVEHGPDAKVLELAPRGESRPGSAGGPAGEQLRPPDEAPESVAAATFQRAYEQATQLREMRERARDICRTSPVDSFSGLSALLEMLLPKVDVIEDRVAGGVGLSLAALRQLGIGAVSPFHLPPDAVVRLARAAELSFDQLVDLSVRDDLRLRSLSAGSPRHASSRRTTKAALGRLRDSWDDLVAQAPPDDE